MSRPNFIIFNPDQWRGDYAGCYGHPLVRTPHLDRLAAQGTRFDQCHVQHSVCSPSRCSFMTGWYPHVRGHRTLQHLLRPEEPNLLECLRRHGYETALFGKNDLLAEDAIDASLDFYDDVPWWLPGVTNRFDSPDDPGYYSFLYEPTPGTIEEHVDTLKVNAGLEFLRRPHDKPFCLFLPLILPHCPFTVPEPYYSMYDPDDVPPLRAPFPENKPALYRRIHEFYGLDKTEDWVLRKVNAVYMGMITMVDELLGRVLDCVDEQGLADSTTVLVHSDHGEWAGDWGLVEKYSTALDDCLTRVPLVIRSPGGATGHSVAEPVELFDQMATILDIAGIDPDWTHFARSLRPQLHGAPGDPDRAVFAEGGGGSHEPQALECWNRGEMPREQIYWGKLTLQQREPDTNRRSVMIRTATHKLILRPETGEHELYHLAADPGEERNRFDDPAFTDIQAHLKERLLEWFIQTSDVTPLNEDPRGLPGHSRYWRRLV